MGYWRYLAVIPCIFSLISISAQQLPDISITKSFNKLQLKQPQIIVIGRQQIEASGATKASELLAGQSNIQVQDSSGDDSGIGISMRGFGDNASSNTLIMIDGVPQNNPDMASASVNQVPVKNIERIEVITGSESVLYGDQAVAGVVNIVTKDASQTGAHALVGYGSYQHINTHIDVTKKFADGWFYQFNVTHNTTNHYRQHNQEALNNLNLLFGYHYQRGQWWLKTNYLNQQLQYAGYLTKDQLAADRRQAQVGAPDNHEHYHQQTSHFYWQQYIGEHWKKVFDLDYRSYGANGYLYGDFTQYRDVVRLDEKFKGIYPGSNVLLGVNATHENYTLNSLFSNDKERQFLLSLYAHLKQRLRGSLSMLAGARIAHLKNDSASSSFNGGFNSSAFVTDLGLQYQVTEMGSIYLKRSGNYRFPKSEENAALLPSIDHLKTQTGASYDIGTKWKLRRVDVDAAIYYMALNNEIVFDPTKTESNPFGTNRNLSPTSRNGINLGVVFRAVRNLTLTARYSYIDAIFRSGSFTGNRIPFVAEHSLRFDSLWKLPSGWSFFAEAAYTGKRFASGDDANTAAVIPDQWIFNAAINYKIKRVMLSLRVNNIFNKMYNAYVSTTSTNTEAYYPAPGINAMLTASVVLW